jgi:hypothetical protein
MLLNPSSKSITYPLENLNSVEQGLNEIEKEVLNTDSVSGDLTRSICSELNLIRDSLNLKRGVTRHEKWAPELQKK